MNARWTKSKGWREGLGHPSKVVHIEIIILRVILLSIVFSTKRWNENQERKEIQTWQNCLIPTPVIMSYILFVVFITPSLEVRTSMWSKSDHYSLCVDNFTMQFGKAWKNSSNTVSSFQCCEWCSERRIQLIRWHHSLAWWQKLKKLRIIKKCKLPYRKPVELVCIIDKIICYSTL